MHASVFTDVGVVADARIVRTVGEQHSHSRDAHNGLLAICGHGARGSSTWSDDSEEVLEVYYRCEGVGFHLQQKLFHQMDVLPFGFHSPSEVFSVVGRHTNHGMIVGCSPEGKFRIVPGSVLPQVISLLSTHEQEVKRRRENTTSLTASVSFPVLATGGALAVTSRPLPRPSAGGVGASTTASAIASPLQLSLQQPQPVILPPRWQSWSMAPRASGKSTTLPGEELAEALRFFFLFAEMLCRADEAGGNDSEDEPDDSPGPSPTHARQPPLHLVPALMESVVEYEVWELALPPALSGTKRSPPASPPHKVGAEVMARRFGYAAAPQPATIIAASYDVSYTLRYTADGGVDVGVLHNDVYLVRDSEAHPCAVRDVVTLTLEKLERAVIVEARADGPYRVITAADPTRTVIEVCLPQIVHVVPLLRDALWSDPTVVLNFRAMDPNQTGFVKWKDVRHLILSSEDYGLPLSFLQVGELQRELRVRTGKVDPQLVWMASVQEEDMLLNFREFEFVFNRVRNMM